jgi:hypothetical protein
MRELMLNLARLAGAHADSQLTGVSDPNFLIADMYALELFSELIVRECVSVVLNNSLRNDDMGAIIAQKIQQHFGVAR